MQDFIIFCQSKVFIPYIFDEDVFVLLEILTIYRDILFTNYLIFKQYSSSVFVDAQDVNINVINNAKSSFI